jgi:hypothetical protein
VIVYSDRKLGKIYSINGYQLISECNIHSVFPVREVRSDVKNLKYKIDFKVWLRKYPIPK